MESIIHQMIEFPKSYLIQYYDDLKSRVDIQYETKLREIQETQLKEETTKHWIKLIEVIKKCLDKCVNHTLPKELVDEANDKLDETESEFLIPSIFNSERDLEKLMHKLQSHLLSNDSCVAFITRKQQQMLLLEQGLSPAEIECLIEMHFKFVQEEISDEKFNLLVMENIDDNLSHGNCEIFHLESLAQVTHLRFSLIPYSADFSYMNGGLKFHVEYLKPFSKLKYLSIKSGQIEITGHNIEYYIDLNQLGVEDIQLFYINRIKPEKGCFNGLKCLTELIVRDCDLDNESIKDIASDLESIETLDISNNPKVSLKKGLFEGFKKLKHLNLTDLKYEGKNCLEGLDALESLNLSRINGILFEQSFDQLKKLKSLNLTCCMVDRLRKDYFLALNNLQVLTLSNNAGIVFEDGCFNGLTQLKDLDLSSCDILELRRNIFFGLNCLECLSLSFNENILMENGCFNGLTQLKVLDLSGCNIREVHRNLFLGLNSLETLSLYNNPNMVLEDGCFDVLKNIKEIKRN